MISPIGFIPSNAGNSVRITNLLNSFNHNNVKVDYLHVLMYDGDNKKMEKSELIDNYYRYQFTPDTTIYSKLRLLIRRTLDIVNKIHLPYKIDEYCNTNICKYARELCDKNKYDCVIIEYVFLSRIFSYLDKNIVKVLDTHDIFANRHKRYVKDGYKYKWFYTTQKEEAKGFERADFVLAIQKNEEKTISKFTNKSIVKTIGHKVEINENSIVKNHSILFAASDNKLNILGLNWFIDNVFLRIKEQIKDVKLIVAGSICKGINLDANENITLIDYFEERYDVYKLASVVINPMLYGTGLKIKTIEALGFGKPLVGTKAATEGLDSNNNTNFISVKTDIEFANEIIQLLNDYNKIEKYSKKALEYAKTYNKSVDNSVEYLINQIIQLKGEKQ